MDFESLIAFPYLKNDGSQLYSNSWYFRWKCYIIWWEKLKTT